MAGLSGYVIGACGSLPELFTELSVCTGCKDTEPRVDYKGEIMSISEIIAPQLPYLRRFARVLSGSQDSGDAYVVAMLEAIAAEPSMFPVDLEPRVATYQSFLDVWNSVRLNQKRYDKLMREVWLGHGIQTFISRKLEADINPGGWETL